MSHDSSSDESSDDDSSKESSADLEVAPKNNLPINFGSRMITVRVSHVEDAEVFAVHAEILINNSEFFRAALEGEWKESKENAVPLDDPPAVFAKDKGAPSLVQCVILGERLLDSDFRDASTDEPIDMTNSSGGWPVENMPTVYAQTGENNTLRKLFVDWYKWHTLQGILKLEAYHTEETLRDIAFALAESRHEKLICLTAPFNKPSCRYHQHRKEGKCYKEKFGTAKEESDATKKKEKP
ncbi:hypothetical protein K402DRAFT_466208 [Aulographum hederae CBS 113979]|uniref:BTB domain-containing protein n=1 Tax=Aulographum hederae CBS 113979 TaxID=1176131 RepID=A0A6G1GQZ8_9PEZI|nr:hypothetical protein K402DRAFT_466208 [Aulographum hederae CBS 113979]